MKVLHSVRTAITNLRMYCARPQYLAKLLTGTPNPVHLWEEDKRFKSLMKLIQDYTLVDKKRCFMIYQLAQQVMDLEGDVAEVGVYKGGTARLLAEIYQQGGKNIHLFDTFSGIPLADPARDFVRQGDLNQTSLEEVQTLLKDFDRVRFHPGLFPQTAADVKDRKFSFVHVDVDIYQSVLDCCRFFYGRMEKNGIIVFDDYGFISCPGARMAVDEFFRNQTEKPFYLPTGQSVLIRKQA